MIDGYNRKQLIKAAKLLKEYCSDVEICDSDMDGICIFFKNEKCILTTNIDPTDWKTEEI